MISRRILIFLIPAFIAALIYGYLQMPKQERLTPGAVSAGKERGAATKERPTEKDSANKSENFPRLRTDLLEHKSRPYPGVRRDLFSAVYHIEQAEEEIEIITDEPPVVIPPPVIAPSVPPPPSPQEVARKEMSLYKFLGFFKKGERKTIFLSTDGEIILVRKGESFGLDKKFYVLDITETKLELRKEGVGDFLIKLSDQESLSAVPLRVAPSSPSFPQTQEGYLPDQSDTLPVPTDAPIFEEQPQFEEDNNEN